MDFVQIGCIAALCIHLKNRKKQKKHRRWWVNPVLGSRLQTGQFHLKFCEHRQYPEKFFSYYRMSIKSFDELLRLVQHKITKIRTNMRLPIDPTERLVITLRYLATGTTFSALEYNFHVAKSTIGGIVRETCAAIWEILRPLEMAMPTKEKWIEISKKMYSASNFPNCLGAIDGKNIRIMCPRNSGRENFKYKKYFSIVLLAVADADYCFTAIDVGPFGRESDSNILKKSTFGKLLRNRRLNIPSAQPLPNTNHPDLPFVFAGGEAFGMSKNLLRPYPRKNLGDSERVFNYRHTRARRFVDCTFGILSSKWRIFLTGLLVDEQYAILITKTACVLHNFVRRRDGYDFEDTLTDPMEDILAQGTGGPSSGFLIRNNFKSYFVSRQGEMPCQYVRIEKNVSQKNAVRSIL